MVTPGSSLFFGVEAKVDEPFGEHTVASQYQHGLSFPRALLQNCSLFQ